MTSDNPNVTQWGQSYTYAGFYNLTDQTTIKGSAPELHVTFNESTNQQTGSSSDANGNPGSVNSSMARYDEENRLVSTGSVYSTLAYYSYAPGNKRVWRGIWTWDPNQYQSVQTADEITFWGVSGQKLARYQLTVSGSALYASQTEACYYFGSKLIKNAKGWVHTDRLGSIGKYYPYGVERPSATQNGTEKFTGYLRDAETGLDYADQRYEQPGTGRFLTTDPWNGNANPQDPGSWNRYAYVSGDPINLRDPHGLDPEGEDYCDIYGGIDPHCDPNYCPPGICGPSDNTAPPPPPPCSPDNPWFTQTQWNLLGGKPWGSLSPQQQLVFLAVTSDAAVLNVDLSSLTLSSITIAGQNGTTQTEVNLSGIGSLTYNLTQNLDNNPLFSHWPSSPMVGSPHEGFTNNFRQNEPQWSMQVNTNPQTNTIQIDVDPFNPNSFAAPAHWLDVFKHGMSRRDTDYNDVAKALEGRGIDIYCPK